MNWLNTAIGLAAAFFTTISYIPQVKKCWETGKSGDLSKKMLLILGAGLSLWIVYGILQRDIVIIIANTISVSLLGVLLWFKLREKPEAAAA